MWSKTLATHISCLTSIDQLIEVRLLKMALFAHFEPYNVVTNVLVFSKINSEMNINEGGSVVLFAAPTRAPKKQ